MQFHSNGWAICCRGSRTRSASWRPRRCSRSRWAHLAPDDRVMDLGLLSHQACTGGVDEHQVAPAVWRPAHPPTEHAYGTSLSFATTTHPWLPSDTSSRKPRSAQQAALGPPGELRAATLPLQCWVPPCQGPRSGLPPPISYVMPCVPPPRPTGSAPRRRSPVNANPQVAWISMGVSGAGLPCGLRADRERDCAPRLQRTRIVDATVPDRASPLNAVLLLVTQAGCEGVTRRGCRGLESPGRFGNACRRQFVSTNSCSGTSSGTAAWPSCCRRRSHAM